MISSLYWALLKTSHAVLPILSRLLRLTACAAFLLSIAAAQASTSRTIALTFDDLPGVTNAPAGQLAILRGINARLLLTLRAHRAPVIGFVNEIKLDVAGEQQERTALLEMWIKAGNALGNHGYSHLNLQQTPLADYESDVVRGERATRPLLQRHGLDERYFRYPFNATGPTPETKAAFEQFLRDHNYRIAPFTVENSDYAFNPLWLQARQTGDPAAAERMRVTYLGHTKAIVEFMEELSRQTFGREIPQVMLLHANQLNAESLDELLTWLEQRGYKFVTLDEALSDAAYRTRDDFVGPAGISWLHRWRVTLRQRSKLAAEPSPPRWVLLQYKAINPAL
jgi:peptidoglycan-N-acetylglucosamine deacetylase